MSGASSFCVVREGKGCAAGRRAGRFRCSGRGPCCLFCEGRGRMDAGAEPVPAESNQALWAGTLSSMEAPDHWLMERRSRSSRLPSKSMRMSSGKGRVASMSLPAGSVWGMM